MHTIRQNLGKYRNELKGFAILWVVFFHAQLGLDGFLYEVQRIGYGGVDIFFFLSGFGLFFSLERDGELGRYIKRRAGRLLPAYLPFCLIWLAAMLPVYGLGPVASLRVAMSNLTMLGFFTGSPHYINWYTGALLVSLFLAPLFQVVVKRGKLYWMRALGLLLVLFAVGLGYIGDDRYMAISRLPVFVLGMIAAGCPLSEKTHTGLLTAGMAAAAAGALGILYVCLHRYPELLNTCAMYWHPFVVIAPVLCAALSMLFARIPSKWLRPLRFLGCASFEIFLFNVWAEVLGKQLGMLKTPFEWLAGSVLSIAAGCLYHAIIGWGMAVWKKYCSKA